MSLLAGTSPVWALIPDLTPVTGRFCPTAVHGTATSNTSMTSNGRAIIALEEADYDNVFRSPRKVKLSRLRGS